MLPSAMMDNLAMQSPIFFISKIYNAQVLGNYSFAYRIATAPLSLVSASFGQILLQKSTESFRSSESSLYKLFRKSLLFLLIISFFLFLPVFLFGSEIFNFIFGNEWFESGNYVEILSIGMFVRFVVSPLSTILLASNNLKLCARWQFTYFLTTVSIFLLGRKLPIYSLLWVYSIHEVVLYFFYLTIIFFVAKKTK